MHVHKFLLLAAVLNTSLYAQDIQITGTVEQPISTLHQHLSNTKNRTIRLLRVQLSKPARHAITKRTSVLNHSTYNRTTYPSKTELNMNDVPVLDQGNFGTSATFAITAAIDAALGKGDYVSQLCQLQLGNYLATNGYTQGGWEGSLGHTVLNQIETYGFVSKFKQNEFGCGGLIRYPLESKFSPSTIINPEEYHQLSESMDEKISWSPLLDVYTSIDTVDTDKVLNDIKQTLNEKDRVTFAVLLLHFDLGLMGAVGKHTNIDDTWVLTPEMTQDVFLRSSFAGHEMIITGYDDDAMAIDNHGKQHKGLFTLRNSWGDSLGDNGNFYMSYDYFKVLVIEAQRIKSMPADGGLDSVIA